MDFLLAEALGTDLPRPCVLCLGCKECKFRAVSISFKENQEYQVILEGLEFDAAAKKWTASYPFCVPPTDLNDNYDQVRGYTVSMERRLNKQKRTEEFNQQFYDTVKRGVFREISEKECNNGWALLTTSLWWKHSNNALTPPPH
jgi:hypothetical protein